MTRNPTALLAATILGSSLVFIDGAVVSVALPVLQRELHATALAAQWVVEAYTLALGALMLLAGALGDRYGRKRLFLAGTIVFAVGSILCGFAPSMTWLIAARILQGIGGTMLAPASLALIAAGFHEQARGKAIGTWSGLTAVAATIGPVAGGVLIDHLGWRSVFFINVPLAAIVLALALPFISESRDESVRGPLDLTGSLLVTFGLGAIVYAFVQGGGGSFGRSEIAIAIVGAIAMLAFIWNESRVANPLVPLALFAERQFAGINLMTFLLYGTLGGLFYYLPFVLIQVDGYSATLTGFASLPFIVAIVVLSRFAGGLSYRIGPRTMLVLGPSIVAAGYVCFALLPDAAYLTSILPATLLVGIGMGLTVAPLTTTLMEAVSDRSLGLASGINNAVSRVAGLLAIAVLGTALGLVFNAQLNARMDAAHLTTAQRAPIDRQRKLLAGAVLPDPKERLAVNGAFIDGFHVVAVGCALLAFGSATTAALTLGGKRAKA